MLGKTNGCTEKYMAALKGIETAGVVSYGELERIGRQFGIDDMWLIRKGYLVDGNGMLRLSAEGIECLLNQQLVRY